MKTKTPNVPGRSARLRDNITRYFSFSVITILLVAFSLIQDNFLGTGNPKNLLYDAAPLMTMSAGMTMVLLFSSVDLSMDAVRSVSNVIYIHLKLAFQDSFSNPLLISLAAMVISLVFGLAPGLALGTIHVKLKISSFTASLGSMSLWQSVALLTMQDPESVPKAPWNTVEWCKITFGIVDLPPVVAIAIILFVHYVTRYTPSGRIVFAIGGNRRTTQMAGMGVDRTRVLVFAINGVLAALAGIFLAANLHSSAPAIGDLLILKIVAVRALGGTSPVGGKGSELGTISDVSTVAIIEDDMNLTGVSVYYQNIVFGIFVLVAIALTMDRSIHGQTVE